MKNLLEEKREQSGLRLYKGFCTNKNFGEGGQKVNRVNKFTSLMSQMCKSIVQSRNLRVELLENKEKELTILKILDKAADLDAQGLKNSMLWADYSKDNL